MDRWFHWRVEWCFAFAAKTDASGPAGRASSATRHPLEQPCEPPRRSPHSPHLPKESAQPRKSRQRKSVPTGRPTWAIAESEDLHAVPGRRPCTASVSRNRQAEWESRRCAPRRRSGRRSIAAPPRTRGSSHCERRPVLAGSGRHHGS